MGGDQAPPPVLFNRGQGEELAQFISLEPGGLDHSHGPTIVATCLGASSSGNYPDPLSATSRISRKGDRSAIVPNAPAAPFSRLRAPKIFPVAPRFDHGRWTLSPRRIILRRG